MPPRRLTLSYATPSGGDGRRFASSADRNIAPILSVLQRHAPASGRALELAAGTGQHSVALAAAFPALSWQPTDGAAEALTSIAAWRAEAALPNLNSPLLLDIADADWGLRHAGQDLVFAANLFHLISRPEAKCALVGIARALAPGGIAAIYGPFRRGDALTSEGDRAFDADLRRQDPEIGYKDDRWMAAEAPVAGLAVASVAEMPANNLMFIFQRRD